MNIKNFIAVFTLTFVVILPISVLNKQKLLSTKSLKRSHTNLSQPKKKISGRSVHKFMSVHKQTEQQLFQEIRARFATTNIDIMLKSSTNFNYTIKYDNYDLYGIEQQGYQAIIKKSNSTSKTISVGVKLLQNMNIRIGNHKWRKLKITSKDSPNLKKINPASVTYSVSTWGSKQSPTIALERSYTYRSGSKNTDKLGFFNVNNLNNNIKHFIKSDPGIVTLFFIALVFFLVVIAIVLRISGFVTDLANVNDVSGNNALSSRTSATNKNNYRTFMGRKVYFDEWLLPDVPNNQLGITQDDFFEYSSDSDTLAQTGDNQTLIGSGHPRVKDGSAFHEKEMDYYGQNMNLEIAEDKYDQARVNKQVVEHWISVHPINDSFQETENFLFNVPIRKAKMKMLFQGEKDFHFFYEFIIGRSRFIL